MATIREYNTNGCTMRAGKHDPGCERHQAMDREESFTHKRRNSTFAVVGNGGAMRKHGNFKHDRKDRELAKLDENTTVKSMVWPVLRRRSGMLSIAKVTPPSFVMDEGEPWEMDGE